MSKITSSLLRLLHKHKMVHRKMVTIPDSGCSDVPCLDLHYYKWLGRGNYTGHRLDDHMNYILWLGINLEIQKISEEDFSILKSAHAMYWYHNHMPVRRDPGPTM